MFKTQFTLLTSVLLLSACSETPSIRQQLSQGFVNPPSEARPCVWWHWMNGNVTREGIRKDLIWLQQSGVGGVHCFDAGMATPQVVEHRLAYMTPEWNEALSEAVTLVDSLQMEFGIAGSPGWSMTGGPWVKPADGMKKLVWRELSIAGGHSFDGPLPDPFTCCGAYQNMPYTDPLSMGSETPTPPEYYQDIAVLAYRIPDADIAIRALNPRLTISGGKASLEQLTDGDLANAATIKPRKGERQAWLCYDFQTPQTIASASITTLSASNPFEAVTTPWVLQRSMDGHHWQDVDSIYCTSIQNTFSFTPCHARYFRISYTQPLSSGGDGLFVTTEASQGIPVTEWMLYTTPRVNHAEQKAGFATAASLLPYATQEAPAIAPNAIIDLTSMVGPDGHLRWTAPEGGQWKVMRFGYSLTGKMNHPASVDATGLEVDKMDRRAVTDYINTYLDLYEAALGQDLGEHSIEYLTTDSWESGQSTWTTDMMQEFEKRNGYSLLTWLPALTGQIVKSSAETERFLYDWRQTLGSLIVENHYDIITQLLAKRGMKRYSESHEQGRALIADGMDVKRKAQIPMAAMWVREGQPDEQADIRESASVAHLYGQKIVAVESFTTMGFGTAWSYCPENLKPYADLELANGMNRFVIHSTVHQPVDSLKPGLGLMIFGQWFNRHETWAQQARVWTDYLARSCYMMQQGTPVADILIYYGDDSNITALYQQTGPGVPQGYNYDYVNTDALLHMIEEKDDHLVTTSGMNYTLLALGNQNKRMSLKVMKRIAQLVDAGAAVWGEKPEMMASLHDNAAEWNELADRLWDQTEPRHVYCGINMQEVLNLLGISPDMTYTSKGKDVTILSLHRKLKEGDFYWLNNRSDDPQLVTASMRISNRKPYCWNPVDGSISEVSYKIREGRTEVRLEMQPWDACFIVFDEETTVHEFTLPRPEYQTITEVDGPWHLSFPNGMGTPETWHLDSLMSLTKTEVPAIRYYSGTIVYSNTITCADKLIGDPLWIDLGRVHNLVELYINGELVETLWRHPYRAEISKYLHAGNNQLELRVVNLWPNRIIGDQQPGVRKWTFTTIPFYQADSPLLESGLIGPVRLLSSNH